MNIDLNLIKAALRDPRRSLTVLRYLAMKPFGNHSFNKFLVLTRSRTGSNLLLQALNSHPQVVARGEDFARLKGRDARKLLKRCFGIEPAFIRAKGFKIFYYHPLDAPGEAHYSDVWRLLAEMPDLRIIHLVRRNLLHCEVADRLARHSGVYTVRSRREQQRYQAKPLQVAFEPADLQWRFERNIRWQEEAQQRFAGHAGIEVSYEDLAAGLDGPLARVLEFLGLDYHPPKVDLKKQRVRSLRETIENYDELQQAFAGTEWEGFFTG